MQAEHYQRNLKSRLQKKTKTVRYPIVAMENLWMKN